MTLQEQQKAIEAAHQALKTLEALAAQAGVASEVETKAPEPLTQDKEAQRKTKTKVLRARWEASYKKYQDLWAGYHAARAECRRDLARLERFTKTKVPVPKKDAMAH